ncbi:MAG: molecular chaperone HtpG [Nitrospirae bacterium]|nr:molecular chaperone HtpG [Nitrospirota bacterium]
MTKQTMEFRTETKQILDLMIHSLYSHKEVFLRELISNASDAIDKASYESLTNKNMLEDDKEWKIKISADKSAGTLTISDNGIGMTKEEAIAEIGTIAHSGTKEFLAAIQSREVKDNPELIGQFGVGFYASFMVADRVTVLSRKAGHDKATGVRWESAADGTFTVEDAAKDMKGTDVILHLKEEDKMYLDEWTIRETVKKYSDFIEHPVVMDIEREEESTVVKGEKIKIKEEEKLNSQKAIWLKQRSDVSADEYNEFYKHIAHDFSDPAKVIHFRAEGNYEFAALLYIPAKRPLDILYKEYKMGLALYVKRVKIMDHCEELIPPYLRFVKGVVDSSDLPLNVSREMLQNNRQIDIIKNNLTKKILDTLAEMKNNDYDEYLKFHYDFGRVLKEGIHFDFQRREAIAELLLFQSTRAEGDKLRTIHDYVKDMKEGQGEIFYITAASLDEALNSPYLEAFKEKDYEVLIMLDDIDDIVMSSLEYKGKKLKSVIKGDVTLDSNNKEEKEKAGKKYKALLDLIKDRLKDDAKDVRLSGRLRDSACCLVADEGEMDAQVEKLLRQMGQDVPRNLRILEINPAHPILHSMNGMFEKDKNSPILQEYVDLLYNQALLLEGSKPKDSAAFAKAVAKLMVDNAGHNDN